jgi:transposase
MRYIEGWKREQIILFPETVDDYISEENMVRFVDAYVDKLDVKELGYKYSETKETGRKPYDPKDMLKLYIYGYMMKIRSSRALESETHRNVELMWLIKKLQPDFKTIADFRKDNVDSIKLVCREFTLFCRKLGLIGSNLLAIDGSKFKAVNSKDKCYTKKFIKKELKEIDQKINDYLDAIDRSDMKENEFSKIDTQRLKEIIENLSEEKAEIKKLLQEIEEENANQKSMTDSDSRMMKTSNGTYQVGYNTQIAVDDKHHLIVESEVTNEQNDIKCLSQIAEKSKQTLDIDKIKVVCDGGYYSEKEISDCEGKNIECYVVIPKKNSNESKGMYGRDQFRYEESIDTYICPQNKTMTYRFTRERGDRKLRRYECSECNKCPMKSNCTNSKGNRYIDRSEFEEVICRVKERAANNPEILKSRSKIIEHVFGTIKQWLGYGGAFLVKGLRMVNGEFSLIALSYNIRRAVNTLGVKKLIESLAVT